MDEKAGASETDGNAMLDLVLSLTEPCSPHDDHPGDEVVAAVADGACAAEAREALLEHVERCAPCRKRLSARIKLKGR